MAVFRDGRVGRVAMMEAVRLFWAAMTGWVKREGCEMEGGSEVSVDVCVQPAKSPSAAITLPPNQPRHPP